MLCERKQQIDSGPNRTHEMESHKNVFTGELVKARYKQSRRVWMRPAAKHSAVQL